MRFQIVIEIEDLHNNTVTRTGTMSRSQAEQQCSRYNDYYAEHCIPRIASVKEVVT